MMRDKKRAVGSWRRDVDMICYDLRQSRGFQIKLSREVIIPRQWVYHSSPRDKSESRNLDMLLPRAVFYEMRHKSNFTDVMRRPRKERILACMNTPKDKCDT